MSDTPTDAVNVVLAGLLREVAALREKMVQFDAAGGRQLQLDGLSADPKPPPQTIPQRIECCEDPEQVAQWHASLGAWVPWLVTSYHLQERVPPCWSQHPQLVEELTGLWLCWRDAWLTPATPWMPTRFHAELAGALGRINSLWPTACSTARHEPHPTPNWEQFNAGPIRNSWWPSSSSSE